MRSVTELAIRIPQLVAVGFGTRKKCARFISLSVIMAVFSPAAILLQQTGLGGGSVDRFDTRENRDKDEKSIQVWNANVGPLGRDRPW